MVVCPRHPHGCSKDTRNGTLKDRSRHHVMGVESLGIKLNLLAFCRE